VSRACRRALSSRDCAAGVWPHLLVVPLVLPLFPGPAPVPVPLPEPMPAPRLPGPPSGPGEPLLRVLPLPGVVFTESSAPSRAGSGGVAAALLASLACGSGPTQPALATPRRTAITAGMSAFDRFMWILVFGRQVGSAEAFLLCSWRAGAASPPPVVSLPSRVGEPDFRWFRHGTRSARARPLWQSCAADRRCGRSTPSEAHGKSLGP
jgi:hypothetical protein